MRIISIVITMLLVALAHDAYAYLDPGTGSVFLQMLIAGIVSAMFAVKMFWRKIIDFFTDLFKGKK